MKYNNLWKTLLQTRSLGKRVNNFAHIYMVVEIKMNFRMKLNTIFHTFSTTKKSKSKNEKIQINFFKFLIT